MSKNRGLKGRVIRGRVLDEGTLRGSRVQGGRSETRGTSETISRPHDGLFPRQGVLGIGVPIEKFVPRYVLF